MTGLAFSSDSDLLASASIDATVKLWRVGFAEPLAVLSGHLNAFTSVAFSRDGRRLFAGAVDGPILIWDLTSDPPQEVGRLKCHKTGIEVLDLAFLPDNQTLISVSETEIRAWRTAPFLFGLPKPSN